MTRFRAGWVALLLNGIAILGFGAIAAVLPGSNPAERAIGVASIGMGLFGIVLTIRGLRQRELSAWVALCFYPVFWLAHLVADLPPAKDHVHQVVLIVVSLAGLALTAREVVTSR